MDLSRGMLDLSNGQQYPLDGSEVPLIDLPSAIALLPGYAQGDQAGTMRNAVLSTVRALFNKIWADIAQNQNGLQSPRFSDDGLLSIWGYLRQMPRYVGETTGAYRTRLLQSPLGVTPNAVRTAMLAAAALFNATLAFQEPANDGEFWTADDPTAQAWCSFWQSDAGIYWNYDPTLPNPTTGGYWAPDTYGALFWVIMQLSAGSDATAPFWNDDAATIPATGYGFVDPYDFWADDSNDYGYFSFDGDPLESQLVAIGNAAKAFGIAWLLLEDPNLNTAY